MSYEKLQDIKKQLADLKIPFGDFSRKYSIAKDGPKEFNTPSDIQALAEEIEKIKKLIQFSRVIAR